MTTQRPNILFIFTDDQTHKSISAYEGAWPWSETPNLDRLAKQGVRFTHAYSGPWCAPSRAMILTGRQLHAIEAPEVMRFDIKGVAPTWLQALKDGGYGTCFVGKWDLPPGPVGPWDRCVAWNRWGAANPPGGMGYYINQSLTIDGQAARIVEGYSTDVYTDYAAEYISRKHEQPWFMWLCYGAPHVPSTPPERYKALYKDAKPELTDQADMFGPRTDVPRHMRDYTCVFKTDGGLERSPGVQLTDLMKDTAAAIRAIDDGVGKLVETLRKTGQLENTVIVFTSDDGMPYGEQGFTNKIGPYDACQRVPMIVGGPADVLARGSVCRTPVGALDVVPTIFSLAGIEPPYALHGNDMSPLLRDPAAEHPHPVMLELFDYCAGVRTHCGVTPAQRAVTVGLQGPFAPTDPSYIPWWLLLREGRYKYIRTLVPKEIEELYDIEDDPGERRNLAVKPEFLDVLRTYRKKLDAELRRTDGATLADNLPAPREAK